MSGGASIFALSTPTATVSLQGVGVGAGSFPTATFTWTFSATHQGAVNFQASVNGNDYNNAQHGVTNTVSTPLTTTANTVINNPGALSAQFTGLMPQAADLGQIFTVTLSVSNASNASTVLGVAPIPDVIANPAFTFSQISGPLPASVSLSAGAGVVFTYTYSASGLGTLAFSFEAAGVDAVSNIGVTSTPFIANVAIQNPAALTASMAGVSGYASVGNNFTVLMTVSNTGGASAQVSPVTPITGPQASIVSISPNSVVVPGLGFQTFTYVYAAVGDRYSELLEPRGRKRPQQWQRFGLQYGYGYRNPGESGVPCCAIPSGHTDARFYGRGD